MPEDPDPRLAPLRAYLGNKAALWGDAELLSALDAETAAQQRRCRMPAEIPADLGEARHRRVARNLAMREVPLGMQAAVGEFGAALAKIGNDAEIARLEAPHRKRVIG